MVRCCPAVAAGERDLLMTAWLSTNIQMVSFSASGSLANEGDGIEGLLAKVSAIMLEA